MKPELFVHDDKIGKNKEIKLVNFTPDPHRVEVPLEAADGQQYKIIILDADDSVDVVIHYPDGDREIVWSLVK